MKAPTSTSPAVVKGPLTRVQIAVAAELLKHFELSDEAELLAQPGATPAAFIESMVAGNCLNDATKFLAHALPRRESVWWACLVSRSVISPRDDIQYAALTAAEAWAMQPTEENRLVARQLAQKTAFKSAASWAATAAWWSAGSIAEPGQPEVPPPPYLYAQAVASAICLAAVLPDPLNANQRYRHYLAQGLDLAMGGRGQAQE